MTEQEMNEEMAESCPVWMDSEYANVDCIHAIQQGGCSSGAYMPAVTYYQARQTMAEHGNEVLEYLDNLGYMCELSPPGDSSWDGIAVFYLSCAVEAWAGGFDLDDLEEEEEES